MEERRILAGRRVLVADDEPFNLSIITRMMRDLGCTDLLTADSGTAALQALDGSAAPPAVAVLDFNMPGANGLQILKKLRLGDLPAPRETKVLMLTGTSDFGLVGAAMALDVDCFVIKPVSLQTMSTRLGTVLGHSGDLKSDEDYAAVDIEAVGQRLLSRKPVGLAKSHASVKKPAPSGIPVRLDQVKPGDILSEDVRSPTGELLLGKATQMSERLIQRLMELQGVLKLEFVYVFPPASANPKP